MWPHCDASGHDSSESLRAPTSAATTALDAEGSGQGQSLPAPEDAKEQAQLARAVQEDVAKAKDSLREGQAAMVGAFSPLGLGTPACHQQHLKVFHMAGVSETGSQNLKFLLGLACCADSKSVIVMTAADSKCLQPTLVDSQP